MLQQDHQGIVSDSVGNRAARVVVWSVVSVVSSGAIFQQEFTTLRSASVCPLDFFSWPLHSSPGEQTGCNKPRDEQATLEEHIQEQGQDQDQ